MNTAPPKPPADAPDETSTAAIAQIYRWPAALNRMTITIPILGTLSYIAAGYYAWQGVGADDLTFISMALICVVVGAIFIFGMLLFHLMSAHEIRFTAENLTVFQSWRKPVTLDYHEFDETWFAETHHGTAFRIVSSRHNRAFVIIHPDQWVRDCLEEIQRIQNEEGWYQPGTSDSDPQHRIQDFADQG